MLRSEPIDRLDPMRTDLPPALDAGLGFCLTRVKNPGDRVAPRSTHYSLCPTAPLFVSIAEPPDGLWRFMASRMICAAPPANLALWNYHGKDGFRRKTMTEAGRICGSICFGSAKRLWLQPNQSRS